MSRKVISMTLAVGIGLFAAANLEGMSARTHGMRIPTVFAGADNPMVDVLQEALIEKVDTSIGGFAEVQTLPSNPGASVDRRRVAMVGSYAWIQDRRKPDLGIVVIAPMLQWPGLLWIAVPALPITIYIQQRYVGKE